MRQGYRPDIDGLRALAVSAVVVFHYFPSLLPGGYVGVDIFFVISGFLITRIVADELERGDFTYAGFYARRLRRLAPALVVVVAATVGAGWFVLQADAYAELGRHVAASALFVSNALLWSEAGYFEPAAHSKPLLHLWSLAVEEQFYIVWPALLAAMAAYARRHRLLLLSVLCIASLAWCVVQTPRDPSAAFFLPFTRMWQLGLGGLLAMARPDFRGALSRNVSAVAGVSLIAFACIQFDAFSPYPGWRAILPTLGAALLIAAGPAALLNRFLLSNRIAVGLGLVSYPFYLWHWPPIALATVLSDFAGDGFVPRGLRLALMLGSLVLAVATYRFVERPWRGGLRGPRLTVALAGAIPIFFALGLALHHLGGVPTRAADADPRARYLQHFTRLRGEALPAAYRSECDFYDWTTKRAKDAIDPACTRAGPAGTWLLWGDSHAQSLSRAVREALPPGVALAQVATSGCPPSLEPVPLSPANACDRSNAYAREAIARLKPQLVVLAQAGLHERRDWAALSRVAREAGARHVVLLGPLPQWLPGLPQRIVGQHWDARAGLLRIPAEPAVLSTDAVLAERLGRGDDPAYLSLIARLCTAGICRATIPGDPPDNLLALDYGHLTPQGSDFVGRTILQRTLAEIAARP